MASRIGVWTRSWPTWPGSRKKRSPRWPVNSSIRSVKLWFGLGKTEELKDVTQRRCAETLHEDVTRRRCTNASRNNVKRSPHDCWGAQRDQDGREPRGVGARGCRVVGGRWALGAGGAGGGDRLGVRRRDVSRGGRHARAQGGRRVGQGRDGGEGEGADRARGA